MFLNAQITTATNMDSCKRVDKHDLSTEKIHIYANHFTKLSKVKYLKYPR